MQDFTHFKAENTRAPGLIAWFSLCLLAAAWGRTLDAQLQELWAQLGLFGLAAAVGLEAVARIRAARASSQRDKAARARVDYGLSRLHEQSAALDAINSGVRRLMADAGSRGRRQPTKVGRSKRQWEAQVLSEYPLLLNPVDNAGGPSTLDLSHGVPGAVRQISSTAISFEHADPLGAPVVIATFTLKKGERLSFVVDVIWTEKTGGGFVSGGTLLAVGVPAQDDVPAQLELLGAGR